MIAVVRAGWKLFSRILWIVLFVFGMNDSALAVGCSVYAGSTSGPVSGKVSINEFNYAGNYIELKILDPAFTSTPAFSNLVLSLYKKSGSSFTTTDYNVSAHFNSTASWACGNTSRYIMFPVGTVGNDAVAILWEDNTKSKEVDYFRIGQSAYPSFAPSTCFAASEFSGTSYTYHQGGLTGSSARKDIARSPDGTGQFLETPYNGADQGTPCASNDGTLAITKSVSGASTVWLGQNVVFHVDTTLNSRAASQSSVAITDQLPAASFNYVSHSASTQGSTYAPGSGDWIWNVGTLNSGVTQTLDITAQTKTYGTLTNSASVQSTDFPAGTVAPASASVTVLTPSIAISVSPDAVSINSNTTFTLTVSNSSALVAPAFTVSNVLATGLTLVSATPSTGSFNSGTGVWSLASGLAAGASATLTVVATVTQSGPLTDTATITMNGFNGGSASATVTGAAPGAFDAWIGAPGALPTQIVGTGFSVTVGAFDASGTAAPYTGNVSLALEYCTNVSRPVAGSISCGGSWAAIAGATSTAVFSNVSQAVATLPSINNAYEIVRIQLTPATGSAVYAADYFAIRPASLTIAATDDSSTTAGVTRALTSGGSNLHKAGWPFTLTVTSGASNYPGSVLAVASPDVAISVEGTLTAGAWTAASGGMVSNSATYDDVGNLTLTLTDQHFADIDLADSTTAQRHVIGSANLGRFVPDHLTTALNLACPAFHYSAQPLTVVVSAYALGAATTLKNYDVTAGFSQNVTLSNAAGPDYFNGTNTLAATSFLADGVGTTTSLAYTFPAKATAPATLTVRATDADGISSSGAAEGTVSIRSGRLRLSNAFGAEMLPLSLPASVEYWDGTESRWKPNTLDTCTAVVASDLAFAFPVSANNHLVACETAATSVSGSSPAFSITLAAPGAGNSGWADVTLNLASTASGNRCTSVGAAGTAATTANRPWLQFSWTSNSLGSPVARVGFGLYNQAGNANKIIDRREVR